MKTSTRPADRTPMSWEEYEALGSEVRGEYVDGMLVMSPTTTQTHQRISLRLAILFDAALEPPARVIEAWAWKPDRDEFIPDLTVYDETGEAARLTALPHLAVEILSTDRAADIVRKAAKYATAGLERYWIIDPEGPEVIVHHLVDGVLVEQGRHGPGVEHTFDVGPARVTFDPASLLD